MLSKKTLFKLCSQRVSSSISRHRFNISSIYCSKLHFSAESTQPSKPLKQEEPKWMRFFKAIEPVAIDLERAVKNENVDMLNNYVKMNYLGFTFTQLITVLGSLNRIPITASRLYTEIKMRIVSDKYETNKKIILQLLIGGREAILNDDMMKRFVLNEIDNYFAEYNHDEKTEILDFMFRANLLKTSHILNYLSFYDKMIKENTVDDYVKSLSFPNLLRQVNIVEFFHTYFTEESFAKHVDKQITNSLANRVNRIFLSLMLTHPACRCSRQPQKIDLRIGLTSMISNQSYPPPSLHSSLPNKPHASRHSSSTSKEAIYVQYD